MNEHELMSIFNKNFQVYTDIRFLKFNIEKALKLSIYSLEVYISKEVPLIYRKTRYLAPIALSINGQKRSDLSNISDELGFIPLIKSACNDDVRLINLESSRKYKLPRAEEFIKISKDLVRKFNAEFNKIEVNDAAFDQVKTELNRLGVEYIEIDNGIEIKNQKIFITNLSTLMLPDKYATDYKIVFPDVRYLYKMKLHSNEQGNRLISVGFITRENNKDIVFHPEDHRVVIENNQVIPI